jgi:hypothetical protein
MLADLESILGVHSDGHVAAYAVESGRKLMMLRAGKKLGEQ